MHYTVSTEITTFLLDHLLDVDLDAARRVSDIELLEDEGMDNSKASDERR